MSEHVTTTAEDGRDSVLQSEGERRTHVALLAMGGHHGDNAIFLLGDLLR